MKENSQLLTLFLLLRLVCLPPTYHHGSLWDHFWLKFDSERKNVRCHDDDENNEEELPTPMTTILSRQECGYVRVCVEDEGYNATLARTNQMRVCGQPMRWQHGLTSRRGRRHVRAWWLIRRTCTLFRGWFAHRNLSICHHPWKIENKSDYFLMENWVTANWHSKCVSR